jgi:hypothetical protein
VGTVAGQHEQMKEWLKQGLTLTKVHTLLGHRGVVGSYRTLHRYATKELGFGQRKTTVRVADCEPGAEVQVTSGLLTDQGDGPRRVVRGLIFTAVYSRHMFVCPTYRQTLGDVIAGFEAAWVFFGGAFAVVIPDNRAEPRDHLTPREQDSVDWCSAASRTSRSAKSACPVCVALSIPVRGCLGKFLARCRTGVRSPAAAHAALTRRKCARNGASLPH